MRQAASRGFWVSSHAPYGYNRVMVPDGPKKSPTLEPDPDAAPTVKRMFDMAEANKIERWTYSSQRMFSRKVRAFRTVEYW